jgi:hypothetical protein
MQAIDLQATKNFSEEWVNMRRMFGVTSDTLWLACFAFEQLQNEVLLQ